MSHDPEKGKPSTGASSRIEQECDEHDVYTRLGYLSAELRALRDRPEFWLRLGPGVRVQYEDFQAEVAALRITWCE